MVLSFSSCALDAISPARSYISRISSNRCLQSRGKKYRHKINVEPESLDSLTLILKTEDTLPFAHVLELLQGPVVRCAVLQILDLHGHHRARKKSVIPGLLGLRWQQLRRQWGVEGVGQQNKLELHLDGGKPDRSMSSGSKQAGGGGLGADSDCL